MASAGEQAGPRPGPATPVEALEEGDGRLMDDDAQGPPHYAPHESSAGERGTSGTADDGDGDAAAEGAHPEAYAGEQDAPEAAGTFSKPLVGTDSQGARAMAWLQHDGEEDGEQDQGGEGRGETQEEQDWGGPEAGWGQAEEDYDGGGGDVWDGDASPEAAAEAWGDGLSAQQWDEVQNSSALVRNVAGWDIYQFSLDGVNIQKYYQHAATGQSQWEPPVEVTRALAREMRAAKLNEYKHEGLDDDDDPKPWVPPTIARTYRARFKKIFSQGKANYWKVKEDEFAAMGVGVSLYFRLVRMLALFFFISTLLYVPVLIMFFNGSRIPSSFLDPLSAALLTLGNIGSRELAAEESSIIVGDMPEFAWLPTGSISAYAASYVISFTDLAVILLFLLLISQFAQRIDHDVNQAEKRVVRARDYTIFVRGLPGDATEDEIRNFFSERFALDDLDVQFRILDDQEVSEESRIELEAKRAGLISQLRRRYGVSRAAMNRLVKRVKGGIRLQQAAAAFASAGSMRQKVHASDATVEASGAIRPETGDGGADAKPEEHTAETKTIATKDAEGEAGAGASPAAAAAASAASAAAAAPRAGSEQAAGIKPQHMPLTDAMRMVDVSDDDDDKGPAGGDAKGHLGEQPSSYVLPEFEARERARRRAAERAAKTGASVEQALNRDKQEVSVVGMRPRPLHRTRSKLTSKDADEDEKARKALRNRLAVYSGVSVMDMAAAEAERYSDGGASSYSPHAQASKLLSVAGDTPHKGGGWTTRAGGKRFEFAELQIAGGPSLVDRSDGIMSASARMTVLPVFHPSASPESSTAIDFTTSPSHSKAASSSPKKQAPSTPSNKGKHSRAKSTSSKRRGGPETPDEIRVLPFTFGLDGSLEVAGAMSPDGLGSVKGAGGGGMPTVPLGIQPVLDVTHNSKLDFMGSWVADVAMVKGDGRSLRAFKAAEKLNQQLRSARAAAKMARGDTPLSKGPDEAAYAKASLLVDKLGSRIAELRKRVGTAATASAGTPGSARGMNLGDFAVGAVAEAVDTVTGNTANKDGDVRAAFVTFEHEESFLRAMAAYRGSHRWFFRCCQARALRFRSEHSLVVKQAPGASDLLWEYIGTSQTERNCRRLLTACIAIILLLGAFVLVLVAQAAKNRLSSQIPDLAACDEALPAAFFGGFDNASRASAAAGGPEAAVSLGTSSPVLLDRPTGIGLSRIEQGVLDQECGTGSFHIGYISSTVSTFVAGGYPTTTAGKVSACSVADPSGGSGLPTDVVMQHPACPNPLTKTALGQCPCIPASSTASCSSLPCFRPELQTEEVPCSQFPINTIVGCFCLTMFQRLTAADGAIEGTRRFVDEHQDVCGNFAGAYAQTQALTLIASVAAAVVNVILAALMKQLVEFERHVSVSERSRALVSKTTAAQVFNTAFAMLLAQMKLPDNGAAGIPVLSQLGILQGSHGSMTWQWYTDIGFGIFTTLTITAVLTSLMPVFKHVLVLLRRVRVGGTPVIASKGTVKTQHELESLYIGPAPSFAERYPPLLAMATVAIIYCPGVPLLAPVACLSFVVTYAFDKYLLLYFQRKPPAYSGALARYAADILPYAVVGHCVMAVMMLGQPDVLPSHNLPTVSSVVGGGVSDGITAALTAARRLDSLGAIQRLSRWNTVFFGVLGITLLAWLILRSLVWMTILNTISACGIGELCSCDCCSNEAQGLPPRKWAAPFSAAYGRVLDDRADKWRRKTCRERLPGWVSCLCCLGCCCSSGETQEEHSSRVERFEKVRLDPVEHSQGWRIERLGHVAVLRKVYRNSNSAPTGKTPGGAPAPASDLPTDGSDLRLKLTWEVINDLSGLSSYAVESNPEYAQAVLASGAKVNMSRKSLRSNPIQALEQVQEGADEDEDSDSDEDGEQDSDVEEYHDRHARESGEAADDDDEEEEGEEEGEEEEGEEEEEEEEVTQLHAAPRRKSRHE